MYSDPAFDEAKELPSIPSNNSIFSLTDSNRLVNESRLTNKLTQICQLHDEICDVAKSINRMFSIQMLILMAYGFMSLTAKFYFVYCGLSRQNIPILFRSAESLPISIVFIVYTSAKCVYVIYVSWQTKLVAQKTGVKIHKVANVVDADQCYQTVRDAHWKFLVNSIYIKHFRLTICHWSCSTIIWASQLVDFSI